jgi:hypothetical protein
VVRVFSLFSDCQVPSVFLFCTMIFVNLSFKAALNAKASAIPQLNQTSVPAL